MQLDRPLQVITPTVDGDVLAALALADAAFTGRGLHRVIGRHSADGVRRALERLVTQGIVHVAVAGPSKLYSLNSEHLAAPYVLALARQRDEFLERLRSRFSDWSIRPPYAALFGSAAHRQMHPENDIDVFVVRPAGVLVDDDIWVTQLQDISYDGSRWTGNDLRILEMSADDAKLRAMDEQVLRDIRDHGIRLTGPAGYLRSSPGKSSRTARRA